MRLFDPVRLFAVLVALALLASFADARPQQAPLPPQAPAVRADAIACPANCPCGCATTGVCDCLSVGSRSTRPAPAITATYSTPASFHAAPLPTFAPAVYAYAPPALVAYHATLATYAAPVVAAPLYSPSMSGTSSSSSCAGGNCSAPTATRGGFFRRR